MAIFFCNGSESKFFMVSDPPIQLCPCNGKDNMEMSKHGYVPKSDWLYYLQLKMEKLIFEISITLDMQMTPPYGRK